MSEKAARAQTRREFLKKSAALGTGAAVGVAPGVLGARRLEAQDIEWDREADVVVVGAGAGGMAAAIAARDEGAEVIVIEQNFDIGGRAILSGGACYLGGGTSYQKEYGIDDSPEKVFYDWTLMDQPRNRYNDREIVWKYVENTIGDLRLPDRERGRVVAAWAPEPERLRLPAPGAPPVAGGQRGHRPHSNGDRASCGRLRGVRVRRASRSSCSTG